MCTLYTGPLIIIRIIILNSCLNLVHFVSILLHNKAMLLCNCRLTLCPFLDFFNLIKSLLDYEIIITKITMPQ